MSGNNELYEQILEENRWLHAIEACVYERLHPEEFNWFEQRRITRDLAFICRRLPAGGKMLDVGCGTGNLARKLLALSSHDLYAVDISPEMLSVFERGLVERDKKRVHVICAGVDEYIGECREKFDLIAMSSVLHHFPGYLQTLEMIAGMLNDNGWLYITHEPTRLSLAEDPFLRKILWQVDCAAYRVVRFGRIPGLMGFVITGCRIITSITVLKRIGSWRSARRRGLNW